MLLHLNFVFKYYVINITGIFTEGGERTSQIVEVSGTNVTVGGLISGENYTLTISAVSGSTSGRSPPSVPILIRTGKNSVIWNFAHLVAL